MHLSDLKKCSVKELCDSARALNIENPHSLTRSELIFTLLKTKAVSDGNIYASGVLEIHSDGYGFLRSPDFNYKKSSEDIYVSQAQVKRFGLREGDEVSGQISPSKDDKKGTFSLVKIDEVNGHDVKEIKHRSLFDNLTAIHPKKKFNLGNKDSMRIIDLVCPIGFGQRCLIVAPPRTGKTVILQEIADGIATNHPEVIIIALLIGERPEEVTEISRTVKGETTASTFDEPASHHVKLAEMVLARAKRLAEMGHDVVILLDSITRLARAYNITTPPSGKITTGGLDANALYKPKQFFGAARNLEEGGSLTIIATALIDTGGSKQDDIIFEEFKGTGNSEIHLDRRLMEKRIFPCMNIKASGTRKEQNLVSEVEFQGMINLRTIVSDLGIEDSVRYFLEKFQKFPANQALLKLAAEP